MPEWYKQIPGEVRVLTAIVAVFLSGLAAAPHLEIPQRVDEIESRQSDYRAVTTHRLNVLEARFESLIERLDRHFCVELAEEAGTPAQECIGVSRDSWEPSYPPARGPSNPGENGGD